MSEPVMPPLLVALLERLEGQEALDLEFKSANLSLPNDLWPTVSAFANTSGGWILLGVDARRGTPSVAGVADPSRLLSDFHNLIRNTNKICYPVCSAEDAHAESVGDRQILVIRIPAAPRKARPVYINGNPYTGTYVRRHDADFLCTKSEVDRMMREASEISADSTILASFGWDDLDPDALARYRRRYQTQHPVSPWNGHDDQRFLQAIGGYRRDRETGKEGITAAGLLLVGKPEAIREWRGRHLIDYRLLPGELNPDAGWDDRLPWEGNLLTAFEEIYPRLTKELPSPFRLEHGERIDQSLVHVALREALVNLLVHADYAETGASLLCRSPDGYLFRNPGNSRISEGDLLSGDRSDPRNPELVRMFRFVGLAEEAGTGIPRILQAWRSLGFRLPTFDVGTERYEFALSLRHVHFLSQEDRLWLLSLGENWTEAEQLALVIAKHDGGVDNVTLRRLIGQHAADVTKILGSLRDRRMLQMIGGGRGARYQLGARALRGSEIEGDSEGKGASSEGKGASSEGKGASSEGLWAELSEIARPARQHPRLEPLRRDAIILDLCARTPLSLQEMAELLGRSEAYLREVLRALLASGALAYLYPERPRHPHQKYVAPGTFEASTS